MEPIWRFFPHIVGICSQRVSSSHLMRTLAPIIAALTPRAAAASHSIQVPSLSSALEIRVATKTIAVEIHDFLTFFGRN
jgi:hypothetical protein